MGSPRIGKPRNKVNRKNKKLLASTEEAIAEYAMEMTLNGQHNVTWSDDTSKARDKLWALLLELEKALP